MQTFDAIVIGSGITGGWAAKELTEAGLSVVVLERGRYVEHGADYHTAYKHDWQLPNHGLVSNDVKKRLYKQARTGYATNPDIAHWFVDDRQHPYQEQQRFDWIRGYHLGGRSLTWGRQCLRLSDIDFSANRVDGNGNDWPVRYKDIAPWYDKVEAFIGVSGEMMGLEQLPDGIYLPPMPLNRVERHMREVLNRQFNGRALTIGRVAHLIGSGDFGARQPCLYRGRCMRGCPTGGYFSSLSSTLPAARATGRLTIRSNTIASEIIYDEQKQRAIGVRTIDTNNHKKSAVYASVIFCCASAIASTALLLQSKSRRFPNGLGNDSGVLGHYLMDHHFKVGATATTTKFGDSYYQGFRPVGFHIPRFVNLKPREPDSSLDFIRGYGYQGYATRGDWRRGFKELSFGKAFRDDMLKPGPWQVALIGFGETLPGKGNRIYLDETRKDEWGLPTVVFDARFRENEQRMRSHMQSQAVEMLSACGFDNVQAYDEGSYPGQAIHEMGTARMGYDPKTSIVNQYNQVHTVKNVYITDGAFMCSGGYQNPSLTYMAFTARAAAHAVGQFKTGF
ncbi:FAD-dependent oxidoreductase [Lacimicrobium alkaliphilum]|uniref:GMC family oxidoreductase n=1 Tax=Lacimicrobium alkaliphilum TaxID=1526571 RepID=A0ABQ1RIT2_9ALTE|nr:GMC family oxidoreductase [Lacimicrobium alkaliphilum]GGD69685.1 GMC family oxidoreductase [Lacimicrobium alkaliphilum]